MTVSEKTSGLPGNGIVNSLFEDQLLRYNAWGARILGAYTSEVERADSWHFGNNRIPKFLHQAFPAWLGETHGGGVSHIVLGGAQQWLDGRSRLSMTVTPSFNDMNNTIPCKQGQQHDALAEITTDLMDVTRRIRFIVVRAGLSQIFNDWNTLSCERDRKSVV